MGCCQEHTPASQGAGDTTIPKVADVSTSEISSSLPEPAPSSKGPTGMGTDHVEEVHTADIDGDDKSSHPSQSLERSLEKIMDEELPAIDSQSVSEPLDLMSNVINIF